MSGNAAVDVVGRPAGDLAALVRSGRVSPVEVVGAHLERIERLNPRLGSFAVVRGVRAMEEAEEVASRPHLADLPMAGVPVAIKDNVPVAGEPMRHGSAATDPSPRARDHEVVRRLRAAGAVVVGITTMPELAIWGTTDGPWGIARNPWDPARVPGGSSGGSAVAVASGMVPVAHASDGLGSIRVPASACGLAGLKPGPGVVPGEGGWFGMSEHGALAATVGDLATSLSVMADRPDLREPLEPGRPLRVAISVRGPGAGIPVDPAWAGAARATGEVLASEGHRVVEADPPSLTRFALAVLAQWTAGVAADARGLDRSRLQPRTRVHAALGDGARRVGLPRAVDAERWRSRVAGFFADHDVLVTPGLAAPPIPARAWSRRSWATNLVVNARYAPFASPWNLARYPAAVVPAGMHPEGSPVAAQLVAPEGGEALLLGIMRRLEELRPWPRHAPV